MMTADTFAGKRILLISPRFFNYEKAIEAKLIALGAVVDYIDERPKNSFFTKALIRINKEVLKNTIKKYYSNCLSRLRHNRYDYVFVVNIEAMSQRIVMEFKEEFKDSIFILYMWDSLRNKKGALKCFDCFDKVFSFDKNDTLLFENVKFRPLFYLEKYNSAQNNSDFDWDLSFIGTIHSDRLALLDKIKAGINSRRRINYFMYLNSPILFWKYKFQNKSFRTAKLKDFSYVSLKPEEVIHIVSRSKCIIDIQHPDQFGLTMRSLEVLGASRKLITTNKAISEYDFYNPRNILIVDRNNPVIPSFFLEEPYETPEASILDNYSLKSWLYEIFFN